MRIPRGRATVKIVAQFEATMKSQETCPNAVAAFERPRKGVQAAGKFSFSEKIPSPACRRRVPERSDGILYFAFQIWSGPAERSGDGALDSVSNRINPKRCRATLATALQIFVVALAILSTTSCSRTSNQSALPPAETREVTDESGRRVHLPLKIGRIVSLAPNLTEIVYAVGAGDQLVGNTEYCDYPPAAKNVARIGDTMNPSIERIIALKPQVVLVSTASQLETFTRQLDDQKIAVYVTNPRSLDEVFHTIESLGELFGHPEVSAKVAADLRARAAAVELAMRSVKPVKVFYQVSNEPLYTIGRESYLTDLIRRAGGVSVTADVPTAFPRFSDETALAARPEAIILPTGGSMGTANSTVATALKTSPAALNNRIYKINEDHLQRPGPRLIEGLEEMGRALHPEVFK